MFLRVSILLVFVQETKIIKVLNKFLKKGLQHSLSLFYVSLATIYELVPAAAAVA